MKIKDLLKLFNNDVYFSIKIIDSEHVTICQEVTTAEKFMNNHPCKILNDILDIEIGNKEVIFHIK